MPKRSVSPAHEKVKRKCAKNKDQSTVTNNDESDVDEDYDDEKSLQDNSVSESNEESYVQPASKQKLMVTSEDSETDSSSNGKYVCEAENSGVDIEDLNEMKGDVKNTPTCSTAQIKLKKENCNDETVVKRLLNIISKTNADGDSEEDDSSSEYIQEDVRKNNSKEESFEQDIKNIIVHQDEKSAFNGSTKTYKITIESDDGVISDSKAFLRSIQKRIIKILADTVVKLCPFKAVFNLHGSFVDNEYNEFDINDSVTIADLSTINSCLKSVQDTIELKSNNLDIDNEGIKQFLYLDLHIHEVLSENCSYLALPKHISTRDVVNVRNEDQWSFKWAVLAALHPEIYNPSYYTLNKFSNEFKFNNIKHPVKLSDIPNLEELNDISFNVFVLRYNYDIKKEQIEGPVYHTKKRREKHINLLLLQEGCINHYCYIKQLKSLVDPNRNDHICDGCLCFFSNSQRLNNHQKQDCFHVKSVISHDTVKFLDNGKDAPLPITIYADFEALLEETAEMKMKRRNTKETFVKNVSKHVPYSFAFYIKCSTNDELSCLRTYYGHDCDTEFIKMLKSALEDVLINVKEEIQFIPIFFHNFTKYDAHFLIKGLDSISGPISAIGNKHNFIAIYKTISINDNSIKLQFLDSMSFLSGSIEGLVEELTPDKFIETRRYWNDLDQETLELLMRKGAFPYEYVTSLEILRETSLPQKEHFYDRLKSRNVSDEAYERALQVWEQFECQSLLDYSMIYLKCDVLLLADLFENLRNICLVNYELDPARYHSMSSVSWDAMLKMTGVELEALPDIGMIAFLKKAMRGGIAHCTRRHAIANNKYLTTHDENKKNSYLMYYDANNLYGWAMSQPLPYGGFEWVDTDVDYNLPANSEYGYFLEVDLEYPDDKKLHDWHADFPFCPEKKKVSAIVGERLITDLTSKQKYVLHHSYLNQCLENGLILENIHRVLKFKQKPWMKPYIDFNTNLRATATNTTEKNFYKRMNNSVFGKTIQNVDKYTDVKIFNHWFNEGYKRGGYNIVGRPEYHSHVITGDNSITVQLNTTKTKYNTPIYVGLSVLDLAKSHMYKFHYSVMKNKFKSNLKLLYTDTDSLLYEIFTEDFYADIKGSLEEYFDTSDYPENNQFEFQRLNATEVGYFKDEFKGDVLREFVALRPKVYMIEADDGKSIKKAASAPNIVRDDFTLDDYKNCLLNNEPLYKEMYVIRAVGHDLYTQHVRKAVLKPLADSKRHMLDKIDSLPFGHYRLKDDQKKANL